MWVVVFFLWSVSGLVIARSLKAVICASIVGNQVILPATAKALLVLLLLHVVVVETSDALAHARVLGLCFVSFCFGR